MQKKISLAIFGELKKHGRALGTRTLRRVMKMNSLTSLQHSALCFKHVQKLKTNEDVAVIVALLLGIILFHKTPALSLPLYDVKGVFQVQTSMSR